MLRLIVVCYSIMILWMEGWLFVFDVVGVFDVDVIEGIGG